MKQRMKTVAIVVGTRPNFIKITQFEKEFAKHPDTFRYILIHTGQHYDRSMSEVFFEQLQLKEPDRYLRCQGKTVPSQIAEIIVKLEEAFTEIRPDLVVAVGDVNSTLAVSVTANKMGIRLAHLESGLRSFDRGMPEEHNRNVTDALADIYFVTEPSGMENLRREGVKEERLVYAGNTMIDALVAFTPAIEADKVLDRLGLRAGDYAVATLHRPSNVDTREGLLLMLDILEAVSAKVKVVFPMHPRTAKNLEQEGLTERLKSMPALQTVGPLGYLAFQKLIADSKFVLTDSGGIQEETTYLRVPCLTLRENTERPVTITSGTNELVPISVAGIIPQVNSILDGTFKSGQVPDKWDGKATERIVTWLGTHL